MYSSTLTGKPITPIGFILLQDKTSQVKNKQTSTEQPSHSCNPKDCSPVFVGQQVRITVGRRAFAKVFITWQWQSLALYLPMLFSLNMSNESMFTLILG
jgi:hypothetical protein